MRHLLFRVWRHWREVNGNRLAAALSFYAILAIAPLLVVLVSAAGWILDMDVISNQIQTDLISAFGWEVGDFLFSLLGNVRGSSGGWMGTLFGGIVFILASLQLMNHARWVLHVVWKKPAQTKASFRHHLLSQLFNLALLGLLASLLILSLVMGLLVEFVQVWVAPYLTFSLAWLDWTSFDGVTIWGLWAVALSVVYFPLRRLGLKWSWHLLASLTTTALIMIGNTIIAWYLQFSGTVSVFGAAGALVALLIWIYYTLQIVLLGATFWYVFVRERESAAGIRG